MWLTQLGRYSRQVGCSLKRHLPDTSRPHTARRVAFFSFIFSLNTTRRHAWICWSAATESTLSAMEYQAKSESRHTSSRGVSICLCTERIPQARWGSVRLQLSVLHAVLDEAVRCFTPSLRGKFTSYQQISSLAILSGVRTLHSRCQLLFLTSRAMLPLCRNFRPHDRAVALQRMQQVGAFLTTAEQVAFQLLEKAEGDR